MYKKLALLLSLTLFIVGCSGDTGGTSVWIDIPRNPTAMTEVDQINIVGHASSPEGVSKVEIWVNGTLVSTVANPSGPDNLAKFETTFMPTGPGEYVIQVVATGANGEVSAPDSAQVIIGEQTVILPQDELPIPTATFTPTPVPLDDDQPVVNYWADPAAIDAGACTTIYWDVQNVSNVEFGGRNQSFQGSYGDCMCESQTYPMTITYLDGSTETFRVTIDVVGVCATATPIPDTTGPPEPTVLKPVNGQEFACLSYLMLRWSEVSDPSGIDEYRIQIQRHPGDNNWQPWEGGTVTGINALEYELYVECGWIYRFRVRGVDGNGNLGDWSDWSYFTVLIG